MSGIPGDVPLYPLTFVPELYEKVWGGGRLREMLSKPAESGLPLGESWELHGASVVDSGPYEGRTVHELAADLGPRLLGTKLQSLPGNLFPLLFKYIDANEYLSVQVHPDDACAVNRTGHPYGKTEAWYILHADPGAQIVHGWKRPTSRDEVESAVRQGRLEDLLEYVDVRTGDVVYVPAGTVHALGGGIVLGEIQQNCDTTYRLYDWGRMGLDGKPRDLHVEESLSVLDYDLPRTRYPGRLTVRMNGTERSFVVACRYFAVEELRGETAELAVRPERFEILSVLHGPVTVEWSGGEASLQIGRTALLPAGIGQVRLRSAEGFRVLRMYVPDFPADVVEPLRSAGYPDSEIGLLGDVPVGRGAA